MAPRYVVSDGTIAGHATTILVSMPSAIKATFAPGVGMIGCSLLHRGDELLGQRGGLAAYAARGSTMGIPLLHPWANRLGSLRYRVGTRSVTLDPAMPQLHHDANGLPMHGLLAGYGGWRVVARTADATAARVSAVLDFADNAALFAAFPFPHTLRIDVDLRDATLTVTTTLQLTGDVAVPVSFGYHPYLQLPRVPRADWDVELPVRRQWVLDERMIPTGATQPVAIPPGRLGDRVFDALFDDLERPARFVVGAADRRITVELGEGYDFAQVYAPASDALICFEPMTAPTNALVSGGPTLRLVEPGRHYRAVFSITIAA